MVVLVRVVDNSHRAAAANRRHSELTGQQSIPRLAQQGSRQQQATAGHALCGQTSRLRIMREAAAAPPTQSGRTTARPPTAALQNGDSMRAGASATIHNAAAVLASAKRAEPDDAGSPIPRGPVLLHELGAGYHCPDYGYADPARQQVRRNAHISWHAAGAPYMTMHVAGFRLAAGMIA